MPNRRPDDFSRAVIEILAKRAGHKCSLCGDPTTGAHSLRDRAVTIGVAAHICAASPGGKRYDPNQGEARHSIENALWTCANCATLIDRDEIRYTADVLLEAKVRAESGLHPGAVQADAFTASSARFEGIVLTLKRKDVEHRPIVQPALHRYEAIALLVNGTRKRIDSFYIEIEIPTILIPEPHSFACREANRSDEKVTLFRSRWRDPLPSRDRKSMPIEYRMTHDIYWSTPPDVKASWRIVARVFVDGEQVGDDVVMTDVENF